MRRLAAALLVVSLAALAPTASADARASRSCAKQAPRTLTFKRAAGATAGRLSWRAPHRRASGVRYRVVRGRDVVGQTHRRSMRVRVQLGRRIRLRVLLVTRDGHVLPCGASILVRTVYRPPSTPQLLAVSGTAGATAQLTWQAARRGEAPLAGYRVLRGNAVYKQTKATRISVPLSSNRTYIYRVAALDTRGQMSAPSKPVTVVTGHSAPPAPAGLHTVDVSDGAVGLAWDPVTPTRGRIAGYRVLRDGEALFQVPAAAARATNLYANRGYTFTVQAVDTLGWASPDSAPLSVTTAAPDPSQGHLHAFLLASTGQSFRDFQAHYRQIGFVYPTYYDCSGAGAITGRDDPLVTGWAQQRRVKVLPRFNCQSTSTLHTILTSPTVRQAYIDGLAQRATDYGYDGANIDFEAGRADDRDLFTAFVADLAARMHAMGKTLSVAVSPKSADVPNHPRSTFFDYAQLAQSADAIFVMAWGIHWATSGPGPQDDLPWVTSVADYVATMPLKRKFVMGTQLYAMDWPTGGASRAATAYEYDDVGPVLQRTGATPRYDATSDAYTFDYTDAAGIPHTVWYTDAATQARRFQLARDRGLGAGVWRLGREHQSLWDSPLLAPGTSWP